MEGVCYQEQEAQPYLDADVTSNLTENGREVRGLPTRPGVDAMGCLSPGQGVVASRGMGSSAFSTCRRGKGTQLQRAAAGEGTRDRGQGPWLQRLAGPQPSLAWAE